MDSLRKEKCESATRWLTVYCGFIGGGETHSERAARGRWRELSLYSDAIADWCILNTGQDLERHQLLLLIGFPWH